MKKNSSNIADGIEYWDAFDIGLYLKILITKNK